MPTKKLEIAAVSEMQQKILNVGMSGDDDAVYFIVRSGDEYG